MKENLYSALAYLNSVLYSHNIGEEDWPFNKDSFEDFGKIGNLQKAIEYLEKELKSYSIS